MTLLSWILLPNKLKATVHVNLFIYGMNYVKKLIIFWEWKWCLCCLEYYYEYNLLKGPVNINWEISKVIGAVHVNIYIFWMQFFGNKNNDTAVLNTTTE